mmetsp:Transcript_62103/g.108695  ORF Transcript_62103/g.108695 Transcript_62103/m.108695 type:complete len:381 (+) Transcript_62103:46-1188(+)
MALAVPVVLSLGFAALSVILQGCGGGSGGGSDGKPTVTTTTMTTTTHTTTTFGPRTPGMKGPDAMDYFNRMYMGFNETNDTSPLGITLTMIAEEGSFWKNIYCSKFDNPLGNTGCWSGLTDCRLSASLYNHKMLISNSTRAINLGMSRKIGIIVNQTLTETYFGKCSYIWDGASGRRLNGGCGLGAPTDNCSDTSAAFYDLCKQSTGIQHTCSVKDPEVYTTLCEGYMGGQTPIPECHSCGPQCLFPGPALNYSRQAGWEPGTNNLRDMAKARMQRQNGTDKDPQNTSKIEEWNEIVIDETLLVPQIWLDPAVAIPAIVYVRTAPAASKADAYKVRDELCETMGLKEKIPVLAVDPNLPVNPFVFEGDDYADVLAHDVVV